MSVLDLARPNIRALAPYSSARMEAGEQPVMLNANESPWAFTGQDGLNRYPVQQPEALVAALAEVYGVQPAQLLVGRGSDEAIDLLMRAFCQPRRDAIIVCPPTFGMYAVSASIQDAGVISVPLVADTFALDVDAVLAAVTPAVKLVFVCSPNNPTGTLVPLADIRRLAQALAERALVVVDEAYIEFSGTASAASLLAGHENLVVLRTLSKAWALAGARVGCLLADASVVTLLRRIMPPYPLPKPSVAAALAGLGGPGRAAMRERVDTLMAERGRMAMALATMAGVREVLPSAANFLTLRLDDAVGVYRELIAGGVVVRNVTRYPGLADGLRISIGTRAENDQVLAVMGACTAPAGTATPQKVRA